MNYGLLIKILFTVYILSKFVKSYIDFKSTIIRNRYDKLKCYEVMFTSVIYWGAATLVIMGIIFKFDWKIITFLSILYLISCFYIEKIKFNLAMANNKEQRTKNKEQLDTLLKQNQMNGYIQCCINIITVILLILLVLNYNHPQIYEQYISKNIMFFIGVAVLLCIIYAVGVNVFIKKLKYKKYYGFFGENEGLDEVELDGNDLRFGG